MARARGDSGLDGFLNVCKEPGLTSHDVVARVRRLMGTRRVGHAGTLDPLAEGVLPLALGRATRLIDRLADADKEYYAEAVLGLRTSTDDAEGDILDRVALPTFGMDELAAGLSEFVGLIEQRPPAYSARKLGGRRAYDLARSGQSVTLEARRVTIYRIECRGWEPPILRFIVQCSKGTYIRSLARDLGDRLGVGASLRRLVRQRVGPFGLNRAASLAEVEAHGLELLLSPDAVVKGEPAVILDDEKLRLVRSGGWWTGGPTVDGAARGYAMDGTFAALLEGQAGRWHPRLSFVE